MRGTARAKFDAAIGDCRLYAAVLDEARADLPAAFAAEDVASVVTTSTT